MVERKPEQLCLLCAVRRANQRGSHFTPNCLLKPVIGGRENFVAVSIDVDNPSLSKSFGRASSPTTEITPNPHVSDYIFCSACEKFFSMLESEICPEITKKIYDAKYSSQFSVTKIADNILQKEGQNINANVFSLFVYSVIWRLCLQQRLETYQSVIDPRFESTLAGVLNRFIGMSIEQIREADLSLPYSFTYLTAEKAQTDDATFMNPSFKPTNPELFFMAGGIVLVHHDLSEKSAAVATLSSTLLDAKYSNRESGEMPKVLFISDVEWDKVNFDFATQGNEKYTKNSVEQYAKKNKVDTDTARGKLFHEASSKSRAEGITFLEALDAIVNSDNSELKE